MPRPAATYRPLARSERLLDDTVGDETVVYDLRDHRAHCLNPGAAHVWRLADGTRTVSEISEALPAAGLPGEPALVWHALEELAQAGLLAEPVAGVTRPSVTRRDALRAIGLAAGATLLLPAVDSVQAPLAAQAASCITNGQCRGQNPRNCGGLPICNFRTWCCQRVRRRRGRGGGRATCQPRPC